MAYAKCSNCREELTEIQLRPITHLTTRVYPGEIMPAGECPRCACLAYLTPQHKYHFKVGVFGTGETWQEAWKDAVEALSDAPGDPHYIMQVDPETDADIVELFPDHLLLPKSQGEETQKDQ